MIIAIDFDGTITKDSTGKILELQNGVGEALVILARKHTLILYTCREGLQLEIAKDFLEQNNLLKYFSYINENAKENIKKYGNDCRKIGADFYIDDKGINGHTDWNTTIEWLYYRKYV